MKSLNVLVVDDSQLTVKKIAQMLKDMGHNMVAHARTGEEAIRQFARHKPDMVTMDITMPDMDGIEATKRILQENQDALILMVTSHGQEGMVLDAIEAGAKGYLLKPLRLEKLKDSIDEIYRKYGEQNDRK